MPSKIFADDGRIVDCNVFAVPKSVFGVEFGVADNDIFAVLKRIVAILTVVVDFDVAAMHKYIRCVFGRAVFERHAVAVPKSFLRVGELHIVEF